MEPRLGSDLGNVRVHTDANAAEMAHDLKAKAFTHGNDIYFAQGKSPQKDELTAHELTHVVQQQQTSNGTPGLISRAPEDDKKQQSYWFQNKPPEKPVKAEGGIEITPKNQVVLDPRVPTIQTPMGALKVQFAGMSNDFQNGTPKPQFAAAEKAILAAISGAAAELTGLPDIKNAESMKAAQDQRRKDETARARLKEAVHTLSGRTLNIFIATDLTVGEKMSQAPLSLRTEQIFVRGEDIGDPQKLEAGIRVPLIALTGGTKGVAPGPGGKFEEAKVTALTDVQAQEALLHEMVHVMLINQGSAAVQLAKQIASIVKGPSDVKSLAEDVLFRYLRAQEEIFVYSAIGEVFTEFKANKEHYDLFVAAVEAFLASVGAKTAFFKSVKVNVREKIGPKQKEGVTWSFDYKLPKSLNAEATQLGVLKQLQQFDIGS